jgi:hypothetical protein
MMESFNQNKKKEEGAEFINKSREKALENAQDRVVNAFREMFNRDGEARGTIKRVSHPSERE